MTAAALLGALSAPRDAWAVPVFARRYATSCQTCHGAFPKLTPFGEAFRRNAYRFPGGDEEDARKDPIIDLGQEAHKKVFPDSVWPGDLPAALPVSAQFATQVVVTPATAQAPTPASKVSFANLGGMAGLNLAATSGDWWAAWAGATIRALPNTASGETVRAEIERIFMVFSPVDQTSLNLRVGRFEPGVFGFSMHRTLGPAPWIVASTVRDNLFTLEPVQLGVEATGVFGAGRATYAVGVVEGSGNRVTTAKDFYGRLGAKLGGLRLDGVGAATESQPWREVSVMIDGFAYRGYAALGDPALATQTDPFVTAGGDVILTYQDASLTAAGSRSYDDRPMLAEPTRGLGSWQLYAQLDYVVLPWLIPSARFERRRVGHEISTRATALASALLRANVRAQLIAVTETQGRKLQLTQVLGAINGAF
ncbi:MAG: hypothetical protein HY903_07755 [Deltaproteobacteria bacterium]|nr:hypothetical protein [Deltaproteobacteria bacterium]